MKLAKFAFGSLYMRFRPLLKRPQKAKSRPPLVF